jgi:hypothetical protein
MIVTRSTLKNGLMLPKPCPSPLANPPFRLVIVHASFFISSLITLKTFPTPIPRPPSQISRQVKELVNFINRRDHQKLDIIEWAALVHYRFSQIQPFIKYTGAVARLLMDNTDQTLSFYHYQ